MQCDCSGRIHVHALEEIDLAALGPVVCADILLAKEPVGGPGTAGRVGHVADICDEEALVPRLCALDAYGCSALGIFLFVIYAEENALLVCEGAHKLLLGRCILGLVLDESICRVGSGVKIKILEEVVV